MTRSLESLNATSEWVAHEFRVMCRNRGWLCKTTGVEALFSRRVGALRVIGKTFSGSHLTLRSLPDMVVRSNRATYLIEAKDCVSNTPNIALELWQFLWFRKLSELGADVYYLFGMPDQTGKLLGYIAPTSAIVPSVIHIPPRLKSEWPEDLQTNLRVEVKSLMADFGIRCLEISSSGSGDPYILTPKKLCLSVTLETWMARKGAGMFSAKERIAWEGKQAAQAMWKSYTIKEWLAAKKRSFQGANGK